MNPGYGSSIFLEPIVLCFVPKHADTCKQGGPKWPCISIVALGEENRIILQNEIQWEKRENTQSDHNVTVKALGISKISPLYRSPNFRCKIKLLPVNGSAL